MPERFVPYRILINAHTDISSEAIFWPESNQQLQGTNGSYSMPQSVLLRQDMSPGSGIGNLGGRLICKGLPKKPVRRMHMVMKYNVLWFND